MHMEHLQLHQLMLLDGCHRHVVLVLSVKVTTHEGAVVGGQQCQGAPSMTR